MIDFGETYSSDNFEVRDNSDILQDAGTVTVDITKPDGVAVASFAATHSATGIYNFDYLTTQVGRHPFVVTATGGILGSLVRKWTDSFDVAPADPGLIVSVDWAKKHLNLTGTVENEELRRVIAATTRVVESKAGATVRRTYTAEPYDGGNPSIMLNHFPVISITTVTESGGTVAASGYSLTADTGILTRVSGFTQTAWTAGFQNVLVTYVAGRVDLPDNISLATEIIVQHLWETQRAGSATTSSAFAGEEVIPTGFGFSVPRRAIELLEPDLQPGFA